MFFSHLEAVTLLMCRALRRRLPPSYDFNDTLLKSERNQAKA